MSTIQINTLDRSVLTFTDQVRSLALLNSFIKGDDRLFEFSSVSRNFATSNTAVETFDSTEDAIIENLKITAKNELNEYGNLTKGWDGYYGTEFDESLIEFSIVAVEYISRLLIANNLKPKEITPGPASDGSIDIEITFVHDFIIFTFYPDSEFFSVYLESEGEEKRSPLNARNFIDEVNRAINKIKK